LKFAIMISNTFVDNPPSVAQGGRGVVVQGCPACKKKFYTTPQFLDHLADDVLPKAIAALVEPDIMGDYSRPPA
jgi:hypothetical protein